MQSTYNIETFRPDLGAGSHTGRARQVANDNAEVARAKPRGY